jgi:hypothetical protein
MLNWLSANIGTLIALLVLSGIIFAAVFVIVRNKRRGRSSCGCGCANCPMHGACHKK